MNVNHHMPEGREESTEEMVFSVLATARRREALRFLEEQGGEASLTELTAHLGEQEGRDRDNRDELKAVYVSLIQNHIPLLEEADIVHYNKERRLVRLTDRAALVLPYLHVQEKRDHTLLSRLFA